MLATLVVLSSLFQFTLSTRLALFRRLITPAVAGTVIMLISVTIMPIAFDMLKQVPAGTPAPAAPACAITTFIITLGMALCAKGIWRLWAPMIGVVLGCLVAGGFGIYDIDRVLQAPWIGLPDPGSWPGFDFQFGVAFWTLFPAFIFVTLVGAIETIGDAIAIQKVSWRRPRATDFRTVQGAVAADGLGNLLSGSMLNCFTDLFQLLYPDRLYRVIRHLGNLQRKIVKLQGSARLRHCLQPLKDQAIQGFRSAGR